MVSHDMRHFMNTTGVEEVEITRFQVYPAVLNSLFVRVFVEQAGINLLLDIRTPLATVHNPLSRPLFADSILNAQDTGKLMLETVDSIGGTSFLQQHTIGMGPIELSFIVYPKDRRTVLAAIRFLSRQDSLTRGQAGQSIVNHGNGILKILKEKSEKPMGLSRVRKERLLVIPAIAQTATDIDADPLVCTIQSGWRNRVPHQAHVYKPLDQSRTLIRIVGSPQHDCRRLQIREGL